jgi:hypothetical protein
MLLTFGKKIQFIRKHFEITLDGTHISRTLVQDCNNLTSEMCLSTYRLLQAQLKNGVFCALGPEEGIDQTNALLLIGFNFKKRD